MCIISIAQACTKCLASFRLASFSVTGAILRRSLHDLARVLTWRCYGDPSQFLSALHDPVHVLYRRSCGKVLAWRSCRCHVFQVLVWKLLWEALGRFLSWRYCELLFGARHQDLGPGLLHVLVKNSWRAPGEILQVSLHDLVQALV